MNLEQLKKDVEYTTECSADSNLQHLLRVFQGYRDYHRGESCDGNPYSPGGAAAYSWDQGLELARADNLRGIARKGHR